MLQENREHHYVNHSALPSIIVIFIFIQISVHVILRNLAHKAIIHSHYLCQHHNREFISLCQLVTSFKGSPRHTFSKASHLALSQISSYSLIVGVHCASLRAPSPEHLRDRRPPLITTGLVFRLLPTCLRIRRRSLISKTDERLSS